MQQYACAAKNRSKTGLSKYVEANTKPAQLKWRQKKGQRRSSL